MKFLCKLIVLCILGTVAKASEPYCTYNETKITRIPVTKTRLVVKKPTGAFKWFKKTKYNTETYEDFVEDRQVKPIHGCCEGYKMTEQRLCEPICEQNCPKNSVCVEPNVCECAVGFVTAINSEDGSHYCEPICEGSCPINARCVEPDICKCEHGYHKLQNEAEEVTCEPYCSSGCPFGGLCISPEQCTCAQGYSAESGTCVPICTAGDGCQHGKCVEPEICVCHKGYYKDEQNQLCEKQPCQGDEDCSDDDDDELAETQKEIKNDDDSDKNEPIFVIAPITNMSEGVTQVQCPPKFFFYNNVCRPKYFASNEFDCRFKPCTENAFCQANGTCACLEGYIWYKQKSLENLVEEKSTTEMSETTEINETTEIVETAETGPGLCLTAAQIQTLLDSVQKSIIDDDGDSMDWMSASVISVGVVCIIVALCVLVLKLLHHRKSKMDVEAKNDLMCSYDNKNYCSSPRVY